jgi:hypothetical protein
VPPALNLEKAKGKGKEPERSPGVSRYARFNAQEDREKYNPSPLTVASEDRYYPAVPVSPLTPTPRSSYQAPWAQSAVDEEYHQDAGSSAGGDFVGARAGWGKSAKPEPGNPAPSRRRSSRRYEERPSSRHHHEERPSSRHHREERPSSRHHHEERPSSRHHRDDRYTSNGPSSRGQASVLPPGRHQYSATEYGHMADAERDRLYNDESVYWQDWARDGGRGDDGSIVPDDSASVANTTLSMFIKHGKKQ